MFGIVGEFGIIQRGRSGCIISSLPFGICVNRRIMLEMGERSGGGGLDNKLTATSILAFFDTFVGWVSSRWAW